MAKVKPLAVRQLHGGLYNAVDPEGHTFRIEKGVGSFVIHLPREGIAGYGEYIGSGVDLEDAIQIAHQYYEKRVRMNLLEE